MSDTDMARKVFEALIRAKGLSNMARRGNTYVSPNLQTKWRYFLLGWTLKNDRNH
jgi:hypothetical protein